ncbi:MAG TPA: hypothetical protein DE060_06075 [Lentisphaeria bacterium]|nr:hypothetical protein [Lentisphaeria bacterium]HCG48761.1 hypothetical protein [Lentisphaeria bacterium]
MQFLFPDEKLDLLDSEEQLKIFCDSVHWCLENIKSGRARFLLADSEERFDRTYGPSHDYSHELFLQLSGGCEFSFSRKNSVQLLPGDILLVPRGCPHREIPYNYEGQSFLNLVFICNGIYAEVHLARRETVTKSATFWTEHRLSMPSFYYTILSALIHPCITASSDFLLCSLLLQMEHDLKLNIPPYKYNPLVVRTLNLLKFRGYEPRDGVRELAAKLKCSPNYLSAIFHRDYGRRLTEVLVEKRLDAAYDMLSSGKLNVAEAAFKTGFRDSSYFSRLFRQRFGISPKNFKCGDL